jgi:hypothetical protein
LIKAALNLKESDIVEKVASIMNKYFPSSEETSLLKVMADLKGSECLSVEECTAVFDYFGRWKGAAVFQDYDGWKQRLVGEAAMKESYIVEKIASVMDKDMSLQVKKLEM